MSRPRKARVEAQASTRHGRPAMLFDDYFDKVLMPATNWRLGWNLTADWVWQQKMDARKQHLLLALARHSDDGRRLVATSVRTLAKETNLGRRTVRRYLAEFVAYSLIVDTGGRAPGDGRVPTSVRIYRCGDASGGQS